MTEPKNELSPLRIVMVGVGVTVMLLSGGCSLFVAWGDPSLLPAVALIGGIPFAAGGLIFYLATRK